MSKRILSVVTNVAHHDDPSEPTGLFVSNVVVDARRVTGQNPQALVYGIDLAMRDPALGDLESEHRRMARVVELRCFIGLEVADIARSSGVTERTAHRDRVAARGCLRGSVDATR